MTRLSNCIQQELGWNHRVRPSLRAAARRTSNETFLQRLFSTRIRCTQNSSFLAVVLRLPMHRLRNWILLHILGTNSNMQRFMPCNVLMKQSGPSKSCSRSWILPQTRKYKVSLNPLWVNMNIMNTFYRAKRAVCRSI